MPTVWATGAACGAALIAMTLATFLISRAWAQRIERSEGPLVDRLRRLQRATSVGCIVAVVTGTVVLVVPLFVLAGHVRRPAHHQDGILRLIAVALLTVIALALMLAPAVALAKGVRPSYGRLRGVSLKQPGTASRALAGAAAGVITVGGLHAVSALAPRHGLAHGAVLGAGFLATLVIVQIALAPLLVRTMGSTQLPPDVQRRMRALADRLGVQVAGFRSYPRRAQRQANALQIGLIPQLRYILISDYLLENLTPAETDAVIAHELGHARGRHLLIKLSAMVAVWAALEALLSATARLGGHDNAASSLWELPIALALPAGLILVQGMVGVRLEERADDAAARAVSPEAMVAALNKLAELNDAKRDTGRGWSLLTQHPGIDVRVERLKGEAAAAR